VHCKLDTIRAALVFLWLAGLKIVFETVPALLEAIKDHYYYMRPSLARIARNVGIRITVELYIGSEYTL
jgi:hypothetical protein